MVSLTMRLTMASSLWTRVHLCVSLLSLTGASTRRAVPAHSWAAIAGTPAGALHGQGRAGPTRR